MFRNCGARERAARTQVTGTVNAGSCDTHAFDVGSARAFLRCVVSGRGDCSSGADDRPSAAWFERFVIVAPVVFIVIVPLVGEKLPVTENALLTVPVLLAVLIVPLIVRL